MWFVGVEATNSGRLGTEIEQFGFQLPNGRHIQAIHDYLGQPVELPMPLAPGRTATMRYAAQHIWEILRQEGVSGENVRPYVAANWRPVSTGHGRFEETRSISASGSRTFTDPSRRAWLGSRS